MSYLIEKYIKWLKEKYKNMDREKRRILVKCYRLSIETLMKKSTPLAKDASNEVNNYPDNEHEGKEHE
jgi:hypothetical protein